MGKYNDFGSWSYIDGKEMMMIENSKQAIQEARAVHERVKVSISKALGLTQSTPPAFFDYIGAYLAKGHVLFDVDVTTFLTPENIQAIEDAMDEARHPLLKAAGWVYELDTDLGDLPEDGEGNKNLILGVDEMWIDPQAPQATLLLDGGLQTILVASPGSGRIALRVEATELFMSLGWRIVPQDRFDAKADEAFAAYAHYLDEQQAEGKMGEQAV